MHPFSPCAIIRTCSGGDDWPRLFWQNLSSFGISSCSSLTWHTIESAWQKVLFFWNTTLVEVFWLNYTCRSFLIVFSAAKAAYRLKWIEVPGLLSAGTPCDNNISPVCHFQSCWIVLERKETFKMKAFLLFAVKWIKVENVFYSLWWIIPENPEKEGLKRSTWSRCKMSMFEYFEGAQQGRRIEGRPDESREDWRWRRDWKF